MFDLLLKNGDVYDGSGRVVCGQDIAIQDGMIVDIGKNLMGIAQQTIDASGLIVSPGFIDMHTHSDFTLIADGRAESQVHQGVTTEVIGQCGISCAPVVSKDNIKHVSPWFTSKAKYKGWLSFSEYLDALDETTLGVNVMAFVGHGTIHRAVMGDTLEPGNPDDIKKMSRLTDQCFEEGAGGLSSGLEYFPGILSTPAHLTPICEIAAKKGRLYSTHVRNRDTDYAEGFMEAITTAEKSGAKLQISHIQPKFGAPTHAMHHTLEMIDLARRNDVDVSFDVIPHDWNHTLMAAILPKWAQAGTIDDVMLRLSDPETRELIKSNPKPMWLLVKQKKWDDIILLSASVNRDLIGATFEEIGRIRKCDPYDAVLDILLEEGDEMMGCMWSSKSFKDTDVDLCLQQNECAVISDTVAIATDGILKDHVGSLSGYGWAARFLAYYVRDRNILSLREALLKITSIPAKRLGLIKRGEIKIGYHADLCVFDAEQIVSNATAKNPRRYASGIAHVIVNGKLSMLNGKRTKVNAGKVLRDFH